MKKILMIVAMMATMLCANAQYEPGTISLQGKVGINVASLTNVDKLPISNTNNLDKMPIGGSLVGVELEYQLTKMICLSAGVHYSEQGQGWKDFKGNIDGENVEIKDPKFDLYYFNIPVVASIYLYKGLAVKAGVQFGFLSYADMKFTVEGKENFGDGVMRDMTVNSSIKMKDIFEKTDISIPIGISYEFKNHLILDARYNLGLTKVNKDGTFGDKDLKNSVFSLTFGYKIGL
jgi:hypothetical protein